MPEGSQWDFRLVDHASEAAHRIFESVNNLNETLEKATISFESLEKASEKGLGAVGSLLVAGGIAKGVELLAELSEKVVELGVDFAKEAIAAADFGRTTDLVFERLLGSSEMGEKVVQDAKNLAQALGVNAKSVLANYQKLLLVGENPANLNKLVQAAEDFGRVTGAGADQYVELFKQVLTKGSFGSRDILMLKSMGVNVELLGKHLGHAGLNATELVKVLKKPVAAHEGIQAILDTMGEQLKGPLGGLQEDIGKGVGGSIEKIKNQWDFLLEEFGKTPEFKKAIEGLFDGLSKVLGVVEKTIPIFERLFTRGSSLTEAMKGGAAGPLQEPWYLKLFGVKRGGAYEEAMRTAGAEGAQAHLSGFKGPQGIDAHSPSKKFADLGDMAAQGFMLGMGDLGASAIGGMFAPPQVRPGGSSRSMSTGDIHVHVNAPGSDAQSLAHAVKEGVLEALTSSMEELAFEGGGV